VTRVAARPAGCPPLAPPPRNQHRFSVVQRLAVLLSALWVCGVAPALGQSAPRLRSFLAKASWVVGGAVSEVAEYDDGRLAVAHLVVERTLQKRGAEDETAKSANVIEMRDLPVADVFAAGVPGIAFLRPARRNSYLAKYLSAAEYFELVDKRQAWLAAADRDDLAAMSEIVAAVAATRTGAVSDPGKRAEETRKLTFRLLAARHPLLVEDGTDSLAGVAGLAASLSGEEQSTLETALRRDDLPERVRVRLIAAVAENDLRQLVPALRSLSAPELQEASWKALRALGEPVSDEALDQRLQDPNATTRIAAVREILAREPEDGVSRVAPLAIGDADRKVRLAAIDALGTTRAATAVSPLETVFTADDVEMRQASARALLAIGGEPAAEAFYRLAFQGPIDAQRFAVIGLLSLGVAKDDPRVRRIEETHSDEKIVDMLKNGIRHEH